MANKILLDGKAIVGPLGFTLSVRDGEYRLAPMTGTVSQKEAQAYYSDDMEDVITTARDINRRANWKACVCAHELALRAHKISFGQDNVVNY